MLAALCVLTVAALRFVSRRTRARSLKGLLRDLARELSSTSADTTSLPNFERIARLARRIVAPYVACDSASLSAGELRALADTLTNSKRETDQALSDLLPLIADLEDSLYAPASPRTAQEIQLALTKKIASQLETFIRSNPPS
jgi:hypothetical protein